MFPGNLPHGVQNISLSHVFGRTCQWGPTNTHGRQVWVLLFPLGHRPTNHEGLKNLGVPWVIPDELTSEGP